MNLETWKQRARRLSAQTYALYLAYRHPRTPWYAKAFAALGVGYVFSPIDPIPDFIPGVGLLDEMVVVPVGVFLVATYPRLTTSQSDLILSSVVLSVRTVSRPRPQSTRSSSARPRSRALMRSLPRPP